MPLALAAADRAGVSCLMVNLRGADLAGEDYGHAGLTDDLDAVFSSPVLSAYEKVYVLGYSLGGHLALSYAAGQPDPRLRGVVAVSSPLDLDSTATAFDRRRSAVYRGHVLASLKAMYRACFQRRGGPIPLEAMRRIGKIREWDERIVAPRFGFSSASDYYARASVAPRLARLGVRSLYVGAADDPMVPARTVQSALAQSARALEVRWVARGGHLGFPARLSLGQGGPLGLEHQLLSWLRR
jgi:predicted alpha/beta-fold hydrolase